MPASGCASAPEIDAAPRRHLSRHRRHLRVRLCGGALARPSTAPESIALLGRRGAATPGAAERIAELDALGAEVALYAGDVADPASLAAVLDEIRRDPAAAARRRACAHRRSATRWPPSSTDRDIAGILRPKLGGAIALDRLTARRSDRAVPVVLLGDDVARRARAGCLCRGQSGARGDGAAAPGRGQAGARDRLGTDRGYRVSRRPAGDPRRAGPPARRQADAARPRRWPGCRRSPTAACRQRPLPRPAGTRRGVSCRSSPRRCSPRSAPTAAPRRATTSLVERLAGLDAEAALALLKTAVAEEAANILRLPAAGIDPLRPLSEMGMDSLMAVELRLALESRLRIDLPLMSLAEGTSVASIATRLANAVSARPQARRAGRAWPSATRSPTMSGWPAWRGCGRPRSTRSRSSRPRRSERVAAGRNLFRIVRAGQGAADRETVVGCGDRSTGAAPPRRDCVMLRRLLPVGSTSPSWRRTEKSA